MASEAMCPGSSPGGGTISAKVLKVHSAVEATHLVRIVLVGRSENQVDRDATLRRSRDWGKPT